jgi:hypothetical protein
MTSPTFTLSLGFVLIVATLLGAVMDQGLNAGGDSTLGADASNINEVLDFNVFDVQEISLFNVSLSIPRPNFGFFNGLFDMLTWNFSYFTGDWAMLRLFFMALSFTVSVLVFISMAPVLISLAEFLGRTAAGVVGMFGGSLRSLFRGV